MPRNPILYYSFQHVLGEAYTDDKAISIPLVCTFGQSCKDEPLLLNGIEVGRCFQYLLDIASERVGLVIKWDRDIQLSMML